MKTTPPRDYTSLLPPTTPPVNNGGAPFIYINPRATQIPIPPNPHAPIEARIQMLLQNGETLYDKSDYKKAIEQYTSAIQLMEQQSKNSPLLYGESRKSALDMSIIHPDLARAYLNRGLSREQLGYETPNPTQQTQILRSAVGDFQTAIGLEDSAENTNLARERMDGVTKFLEATPSTPTRRPPTP